MTGTDDRRGPIGAAAVAVLLLLASATAIVVGVRGSDGPPQPAAAAPLTSTPTPARDRDSHSDAWCHQPGDAESARPVAPSPLHRPSRRSARSSLRPGPRFSTSRPSACTPPTSSTFASPPMAAWASLDRRTKSASTGTVRRRASWALPCSERTWTARRGLASSTSLGAVKIGAKVQITRADRSVTTFVVDKVQAYPEGPLPGRGVHRRLHPRGDPADHLWRNLRPGHRPLPRQHRRLRPPHRHLTGKAGRRCGSAEKAARAGLETRGCG